MNTINASILLEQAIQILSDSPSPDDAVLARDALVAFRDGWFAQHRTRAHREPKAPAVPLPRPSFDDAWDVCDPFEDESTTH